MGLFLRDQHLKNVSVTATEIEELCTFFIERQNELNKGMAPSDTNYAKIHFVIRFDNKGYRFEIPSALIAHYNSAKNIERIALTMETQEARFTQGMFSSKMDLWLDSADSSKCFFSVTSDNSDWVDASFSQGTERLSKFNNRHGYVRTQWTLFAIQLVGLVIGFFASLVLAVKLEAFLKVPYALTLSFFFCFLVWGQMWHFLFPRVIAFSEKLWPNVKFLRVGSERWHWVTQAVATLALGGAVTWACTQMINYAGQTFVEVLRMP